MNVFSLIRQFSFSRRVLSALTAFFFLGASIFPTASIAQIILNLPVPGSVVAPTAGFAPAMIKGVNLYPDNPLKFDFIIDKGDTAFTDEEFKKESTKLIKYFLSSLTVPEDEMWVNLSPYEKNRIVPQDFGKTEMGRDLLAQDYMLKQLTASLMNPDDKLGGEFWQRVYSKAQEKYGTTDIPMNTFNKIWIVPEKAVVYEHEKGAFVVKSHLKVMLEEDYLALHQNGLQSTVYSPQQDLPAGDRRLETVNLSPKIMSGIQSKIVKDLLIPEIEREVNAGQTFANLRQIYNAVILASWYKQALKESLLGQVYIDQKKTKGVETEDKTINEQIYNQYVESFKKGVYNTIKEDYDPETQEVVNRKYFSGGANLDPGMVATTVTTIDQAELSTNTPIVSEEVDLASLSSSDAAMAAVARELPSIKTFLKNTVLTEDVIESRIGLFLNLKHSQESFNIFLKELKTLWNDPEVNLNRFIGLKFEDAMAYYFTRILDRSTFEKNIAFLANAPDSKEIIARFGINLWIHFMKVGVFHGANVNGDFVDNRVLSIVIEGFVKQSEWRDFQSDGSTERNREVFPNLYLLLVIINPYIYPDTTSDDKKMKYVIPEEAKWATVMKEFKRVLVERFGKEKYLIILEQLEKQEGVLEGVFLPWEFTMLEDSNISLKEDIKSGKRPSLENLRISSSKEAADISSKILRPDELEKRNDHVKELMAPIIAEARQAVSSAMLSAADAATLSRAGDTKGGIDLNPTILSTEIKRNGRGVIIPVFKGTVPDLNGVEGFVPNIINVTPITNLQLLLGLDVKSKDRPQNPKNENDKPVDVSFKVSALPAMEMEKRHREKILAVDIDALIPYNFAS